MNGQPVSSLVSGGGIDGVTALNGQTVLFYKTDGTTEQAFVSSFYDETNYDVNDDTIITPATISVVSCDNQYFTVGKGEIVPTINDSVTFDNPVFGGVVAGQVYFVKTVTSTSFSVSLSIGAPTITLTASSGNMTCNVNQGLYLSLIHI